MRASSPSSSSSASSSLNSVIWLRFALLHRAKLISSPINAELKRGFKYLTAAVNNMQRITLQVCVCFFFFSHSLSLSLSISVVIGTVVTAVGSCSEMTVMPLLMLILFPSEHHRVIRQRFSPQGGDYICLCRQILYLQKPPQGFTHREQRCVNQSFLWAGDNKAC